MKMPNEAAGGTRTQTAFDATVQRARASLDPGRLREAFVTLGSLGLTASQSPEAAYLRIGIAIQMDSSGAWAIALLFPELSGLVREEELKNR